MPGSTKMSLTVKNTFLDVRIACADDEPLAEPHSRACSMPPPSRETGAGREMGQLARLNSIVFGPSPTPAAHQLAASRTEERVADGQRPAGAPQPRAEALVGGPGRAGGSPSVGSTCHGSQTCRPCAFLRSQGGCRFGESCGFCHLLSEHPGRVRLRLCKGARQRLRSKMAAIADSVARDPDLVSSGGLQLPRLADRNPEARAHAMAQLARVAEAHRGPSES